MQQNILEKPYVKAGLVGGVISGILSVVSAIPLLSCCLCPVNCLLFFLLPMTIGFLAAHWKNVKYHDLQEAVKQGALAGAIMGVIGGIVAYIVQIFSAIFSIALNTPFYMFEQDSNIIARSFASTANIGATLVCGIFVIILLIIVDTMFAIFGGLIRGLFPKSEKAQIEDAVIVKKKKATKSRTKAKTSKNKSKPKTAKNTGTKKKKSTKSKK